ncbi:acyltransferase family protein [Luteimicrobium sp. NPDC057192]|uniref:acyltransferase family protein n=1 Tax=Luteimicrobium sp. NPDC057192 TaxID=3346042 RepID=UPI00362E494A
MSASAPPRRSRLRALDGLRFLAAAAVLLYHYTGIRTSFWGVAPTEEFPGLNHLTRYGFLGVQLFFVISGFVILMTAYGRPVTAFTASRIARLFPAYWAAVVVTVLLQVFWHGGRQPSKMDSLVNLTMLQGAWDAMGVQGAFWTLWYELKFYLLIGVFILVGITRRRIIAFAVFWPLVAQLAHATHSGILDSLLIPTYAPYFAAGMLLYLLYRDGNDVVVWLGLGLTTILSAQQAHDYAAAASRSVGAAVSPTLCALAVVAMVAAIWLCTCGPLRNLDWRFLTVLGALTYPLYLVHGQFGFFVIDVLHGSVNRWVVLALAAAVSVALAAVLHYAVENRVHDRLRGAVGRALEDVPVREPARSASEPAPSSAGTERARTEPEPAATRRAAVM